MSEFKKVGFVTCAALVVANMIGTGVFTSLGFQVADIPSPAPIILLWVMGGVVAFCGAMSYSELAAALPRSGGEYNFLTQIYHPALGFAAGFVSIAVGFSAPIALSSIAFAKYFSAAWPGVQPAVASSAIVIVAAVAHSLTVALGGKFQVTVTSLKVLLILSFIGLGVYAGGTQSVGPKPGDAGLIFSAPFAVSLMFVLYAYSGWNAATYIVGEVKDPQKNVPRALLAGTAFVMLLYVALNTTFLRSAPLSDYAGHVEVGRIAAEHLLGERGGRILSTLIAIGLISTISAMTWAGPRVSQALGRDHSALRWFAKTSEGGVPRVALAFQTGLVLFMIWTASFEAILLYAQFALLLCGFATVLGVFVLRIKKPDLPRPFKCWGYPFTPLVYLSICLFAVLYSAKEHPHLALAGAGTLVAGVVVFFGVRLFERKDRGLG